MKHFSLGVVLLGVGVWGGILFGFPVAADAATFVSGTVATNIVWTAANSPYVVQGTVTVAPGATLTVEPGTVVKFSTNGQIVVNGTFIAEGTAGKGIYFTSLKDDGVGGDTNGDGATSAPKVGDWVHINFNPGSSGRFSYATIRYGGFRSCGAPCVGSNAQIRNNGGTISIDASSISQSARYGILQSAGTTTVSATEFFDQYQALNITSGDASIAKSTIRNHVGFGVFALGAGTLMLNDNIFADNLDAVSLSVSVEFIHGGNNVVGARAQSFHISSTAASNRTLMRDNLSYVVSDPIAVSAGVTFTIDPGAILKFEPETWLRVRGKLAVNGTAATPVTFTSIRDDSIAGDTNGDGTTTAPQPGDWVHLEFLNGSSGTINGAVIRYAGGKDILPGGTPPNESLAGIFNNGGALTVADSFIGKEKTYGICQQAGSLEVKHSEITENQRGIQILGGIASVAMSSIYGNSLGALLNSTVTSVEATQNWWGAMSGPFNQKTNPTGTGNSVSDRVNFIPWLGYDPIHSLPVQTPSLENLVQFKSDGVTVLGEGTTVKDDAIIFGARLTDSNNDTVRLQVELRQFDEPFTGNDDGGILRSQSVVSERMAYITRAGLINGKYHWRARAVDDKGNASDWQEFGTAGNVDFEIKRRNPVIIIPGIMSTYLVKEYGDYSEIWPNAGVMAKSISDEYLNDLALLPSGVEDENFPIELGDIIRETPTGTHVFDLLIQELKENDYQEGVDLFVFPYDWRMDSKYLSGLLGKKIDEVLIKANAQKVDVIAHSMGGLVAKAYVHENGKNEIDQLVFIGTPHIGSPLAFKALMYGDNMGLRKFKFGLNPDRVKFITQNMPSAFQLLPSKRYVDTRGYKYVRDLVTERLLPTGGDPDLNYDQTKDLMMRKGRNLKMFPFAEVLHDGIDGLNLEGIKTYNFVGCGVSTLGRIQMMKKKSTTSSGVSITDDFALGVTSGDGTVPLISAADQSTDRTYYVNSVAHAELPSADGVREMIAAILDNQEPELATHIRDDTSVCSKVKLDIISVHSPVNLHVYDSQERHTGPDASGNIEYGIPGVTYDIVGEAKFAFLPEGETYRVITEATDTGAFDFYVQKVEDERVIETSYFNEIPLATLQARSETTVAPGQSNIVLHADQNGDGHFESILAPSSTLNEEESQDVRAAETAHTIEGTIGNGDWYLSEVKAVLAATDEGSGVLKTEYSLDAGVHWIKYESPIVIVQEGTTTIQYFSIDKAGNIESIKTLLIKIDRTPPEAAIYFDPSNKMLIVEGIDNFSKTTTVKSGQMFTINDEAGHMLAVQFENLKREEKRIKAVLRSLQYDRQPVIILPRNEFSYSWSFDKKTGIMKELKQHIEVKKDFDIRTTYNAKKDETEIKTEHRDGKRRIGHNGLVLIKIISQNGRLEPQY